MARKKETEDDAAPRDEYLAAIGERVRQARLAAGLSQRDLGEAAGVSAAYVWLVETGKQNVTLTVFKRIAEGVGLATYDLLAGIEAGVGSSDHTLDQVRSTMQMLISVLNARRKQESDLVETLQKERRESVALVSNEIERLLEGFRKVVTAMEARGEKRPNRGREKTTKEND